MKTIVIFADFGLDDAAATISIFNSHEGFGNIVIIPIGGNVPVDMSYRNCCTLLSYYPELLEKITLVNTCSIKQPNEYLADIHGVDGMGDVFCHPDKKPDVKELSFDEWLACYTGEEIVLSLGPMTLVKEAVMKKAPQTLVIMGGCIHEAPNFNGYEFNHCLDVEAFNYCVQFPHVAITLDTCRVRVLDMRQYEITGDDIHSVIVRADQRLSITRHEEGCYVWDDIAANYILYPERFEIAAERDKENNLLYNARYISDKIYYEA